MKRPTYIAAALVPASTGISPPTITPSADAAMVHLKPNLRQMNAAGNAKKMPMIETMVISMPKPAASNWKPPSGLTPGT